MAEMTNGAVDSTNVDNANVDNATTPTVDELLAQIEQLKQDKVTSKKNLDAALKKAGDATKALRAKQSEDEIAAAEKAEADKAMQEKYEEILRENNRMKAISAYKNIRDEKAVDTLIEAVAEGNHATVAEIINNEIEIRLKEAKAEWYKGRPQANATNMSSGMTKDQIMAISDRSERLKAIALNKHLF